MRDSRYGRSTGRYGRRSTERSSKDSWKEFEAVSEGVLSEQPISGKIRRMMYIRGELSFLERVSLS